MVPDLEVFPKVARYAGLTALFGGLGVLCLLIATRLLS